MKKSIFALVLVAAATLSFSACRKECQSHKAEILHDCGNSFIKVDEKLYAVCNVETVQNRANNTQVTLKFKTVSSCSYAPEVMCLVKPMYSSDTWVEITNIQ
jgi:hypothetical protein